MIAVLDHLDLNPVTFVRRVVGEDDGLDLDPMPGEPPPLVTKARERLAAGKKEGTLGSDYLELLDKERYEKAEWVTQQALWAVNHIKLPLLPRLLGVAGSTYRLMSELDVGRHTVLAALDMARRRREPTTVAELLQRLAYIVADDGGHAQALRYSELATLRYLRLGDDVGFGKTLVDQGIWLHYLDRPLESIQVQEKALRFLPETLPRNRCTALMGLGLNFKRLGEPLQGLAAVERARASGAGNEDWMGGKLKWLEGELYCDLGELEKAENLLYEVVEEFRHLHIAECAVATCDLVRVQLLQNRPESAIRTARSMVALLEPLRHNRIVSAAIADLLRKGLQGLTLALVGLVKARIEGERRDPAAWRALRGLRPTD